MTDKEKAAAEREKLIKSLAADSDAEKERRNNMSRTERKRAARTALSDGGKNHVPAELFKSDGKPEKIETGVGSVVKFRKEETDLGEGRALTVAQRLQRGRQIRKIKPKMRRAAKRALTQAPSASRLWKRSQRAARTVLKNRFSPVKGVAYAKLTTTQKIFVDRALEKRQKLIRKVAKRLLPKVRAASFKRLQSYRTGTGRSKLRENAAFEAQFNQRPLPQIVESMIIDMGDHPMADSLMTLLDLAAAKDSPAVKSLKEKAASIKVPFAEILQVYADALLEYKRTGSKLSGEQYAFNAVNSYVADQRAPTINEQFNENWATARVGQMMMFGPSSVGRGLGVGHGQGGGSRDHYSTRDKDDDDARTKARHAYGAEVHAFAAHFNQANSLPHLRDKVAAYDKHYRAAKGLGESVSFKSHGEEEDGHHLLWKDKKIGDLRLVSKGITRGGNRYTLHKANFAGEPVKNVRKQTVSLTMRGWQDLLHKHFTKHDQLNAMRSGTKTEMTTPDESMLLHTASAVDMMRKKGKPIKGQVADVVGTIGALGKMKAGTLADKIKARRALNKEPE